MDNADKKIEESCDEFERSTLRLFRTWSYIYDSFLPRYFYFNTIRRKTLEMIAQFDMPLKKHKSKFLDAACGTGEILAHLAERYQYPQFIGIDLSPHMLTKAREKMSSSARVMFHQANITHLPFLDCTFHMALCSDALHHFAKPQEALQEIRRVIKSEAIFIILDPAADTFLKKTFFQLLVKPWDKPKCYYAKNEVCALLLSAGFGIRAIYTHYFTNFFIAYKR